MFSKNVDYSDGFITKQNGQLRVHMNVENFIVELSKFGEIVDKQISIGPHYSTE